MEGIRAGSARTTMRPLMLCRHFIERLNATFTVLKNCKFQAFLHGRINCAEIVAP
jgi:hypothetical protein